jgi:hypothetical protein
MFSISVNPTKRIRHSCSAWNFVFASVVGHRFRFRKCALILKTVYWLMHGKSFSIAQQTAKVGPVSARECRWSMTELWLRASPAAKLAERHPFPDHILPYGWRVASLGQWYSKENCAIFGVWLYATFYVVDSDISSEQSFKIGCMTLCPFFVFFKESRSRFITRFIPLLRAYDVLHDLLPVSFPCCEPTTFYGDSVRA